MSKKRCFFIGHRETSEEIYPALYEAVEKHITEYGVTEFPCHCVRFPDAASDGLCDQKHDVGVPYACDRSPQCS